MQKMQTVVITGGAGFLGSNLAHHLTHADGCRVIVVDRFDTGPKWQNLVHVPVAEVIDPAQFFFWLESFGDEVDVVFHLGGVSSTTEQNVGAIMESNHQYPLLLWRWCAENGKRFFYASSAEVYGAGEHGFSDGEDPDYLNRLRPLNPNGWSKKLFDLHVAQAKLNGRNMPPQWAGLRLFNVYGPNESHKGPQRSVLLQLYEEAAKGLPAKLFKSAHPDYADGAQVRDFTYVRDVVSVYSWLLKHPKISGIFNCGTGQARSFAELAQALFAALGKPPQVKYVDMPVQVEKQYQYRTEADITRLRQAGYDRPFITLEQGATDYIQNYLKKADPYL